MLFLKKHRWFNFIHTCLTFWKAPTLFILLAFIGKADKLWEHSDSERFNPVPSPAAQSWKAKNPYRVRKCWTKYNCMYTIDNIWSKHICVIIYSQNMIWSFSYKYLNFFANDLLVEPYRISDSDHIIKFKNPNDANNIASCLLQTHKCDT